MYPNPDGIATIILDFLKIFLENTSIYPVFSISEIITIIDPCLIHPRQKNLLTIKSEFSRVIDGQLIFYVDGQGKRYQNLDEK